MSIYKFRKQDTLRNRLKTYPSSSFLIYSASVYYNNEKALSGAFIDTVKHVPNGHISLYELNVDRDSSNLIYQFITKEGSRDTFSTVSSTSFNSDFAYGDTISSTYPLSASISSYMHTAGDETTYDSSANVTTVNKPRIIALKNTLDYYKKWSPHYAFSSSLGDKGYQTLRMIEIPSIFYGSSIKKGSVDLRFFVTGTLVGQLKDERRNGELVQVGPEGSTGSGSVAGVVLYTEGFILLTGSWTLDATHAENYDLTA